MKLVGSLRNTLASDFETALGASPRLQLWSGAAPATPDAAPAGTLLAEMTLPADAFTGPVDGVLTKSGTWEDLAANAAGAIGFGRFTTSAGAGVATVTVGTSGAELNLSTLTVALGQPVTVNSFTVTAPGA